jgi:hypothetical protein
MEVILKFVLEKYGVIGYRGYSCLFGYLNCVEFHLKNTELPEVQLFNSSAKKRELPPHELTQDGGAICVSLFVARHPFH